MVLTSWGANCWGQNRSRRNQCLKVRKIQIEHKPSETYPDQLRIGPSKTIGTRTNQARSLRYYRTCTLSGRYVATELEPKLGRYVATELELKLGRYVETECPFRSGLYVWSLDFLTILGTPGVLLAAACVILLNSKPPDTTMIIISWRGGETKVI
ncbi:hypothetical protein F2Q68_00038977 [Brassica cretica]|uniref:Uncharacterized protein n=1 Tax=Brassica cretica TaxID=69181 RepID=A0A8S9MMD4_BRACR|nr:hypothetical protein F2Q68_00038977 [Brassica cretica]